MSKNVENNKDGGILSPDPGLAKSTSFRTFLYDPSTGAVFGRTGASWGKNFKISNLGFMIYCIKRFQSSSVCGKVQLWGRCAKCYECVECMCFVMF